MARLCLFVSLVTCLLFQDAVGFQFSILHTNDVQSRFEETDQKGNECTEKDKNENSCVGGFARMKTFIDKTRADNDHVLLLDAGSQYTGTLWFYVYGGSLVAKFMNLLGYDAMSLGNHEFDSGSKGLLPLLNDANFSILGANINASLDPYLSGKINASWVFSMMVNSEEEKVGVVGYISTDTANISKPGDKIEFYDEIESIQKEVDRLKTMGVNKIIALGHSGFKKDLEIAEKVNGVDVVIGGQTNTFLYNGTAPSTEKPQGPYPHVVTREDGSKVLVVQAYALGKYVGFLTVSFNASGNLDWWKGNPVLMDNSTQEDADILKEMEPYKANVSNFAKESAGTTHVPLEADAKVCRKRECNLGNVITDALVWENIGTSNASGWNHVAMAIFNSGGIRRSIGKGDVNMRNVINTLPYLDTMDIIMLKGMYLKEVFTHSSSKYHSVFGGFLQVSGIKVKYAMHKPVDQRVEELLVRCHDCDIPEYRPVDDEKVYPIVTPSFLANGGDGYMVLKHKSSSRTSTDKRISDILAKYLRSRTPVTTGLEGRITMVAKDAPWCLCWSNQDCPCPSSASTVSMTSLLFSVVSSAFVMFVSGG
ncbi:snake venom 5'-nucleotidase-like [Gigantopelta aegis]|uniref:snake venom 5'-nucleotidase-like n=1 Tax=Gigantopelta aegis TaxID=1735272 RepID=UPI001B88DBBC|nr:snake venom 5'-nucleotidase-like [Gigantopelta aegis]